MTQHEVSELAPRVVLYVFMAAVFGLLVLKMVARRRKGLGSTRELLLFAAFVLIGLCGFFFDPFPKVR